MIWASLLAIQQPALDQICASEVLKGASVSAYVCRLTGETLYEKNADLRLMPGSNQKLVSALFALDRLGPDWRPEILAWKSGKDVRVLFGGDPMMTSADIGALDKKLPPGTRTIFEAYRPGIPPGWEVDDIPNRYAAQITALTVDRGGFELFASHGKLELPSKTFGIRTKVMGGDGPVEVDYDPLRKSLRVSGKLPAQRTRLDTLSIPDPDQVAAIALHGRLSSGPCPESRPPNWRQNGHSIGELVNGCLPSSDNLIAENLLMLAAVIDSPSVKQPYEIARAKVEAFLSQEVGITPGSFQVRDGSGMSRHNLVTTKGMAKLLVWAKSRPYCGVFESSLVRPGSGTLKTRLGGSTFRGKTGTLDNVVALSGYIGPKGAEPIVVSMIVNHATCTDKETRAIVDDFIRACERLYVFGTNCAMSRRRESDPPFSELGGPDDRGICRFDRYRLAAFKRNDRRIEPNNAPTHRAQ